MTKPSGNSEFKKGQNIESIITNILNKYHTITFETALPTLKIRLLDRHHT